MSNLRVGAIDSVNGNNAISVAADGKSTFSSTVYSEVRFLKYASEDSTTWQNYKSNNSRNYLLNI